MPESVEGEGISDEERLVGCREPATDETVEEIRRAQDLCLWDDVKLLIARIDAERSKVAALEEELATLRQEGERREWLLGLYMTIEEIDAYHDDLAHRCTSACAEDPRCPLIAFYDLSGPSGKPKEEA